MTKLVNLKTFVSNQLRKKTAFKTTYISTTVASKQVEKLDLNVLKMGEKFSVALITTHFFWQVNKSLQDRLRRERISKSVDALRELVLGPSIEHVSFFRCFFISPLFP